MPVIPYIRATHSDGQDWTAAKANVVEAGVNDAHYMPAVRVYHNTTQSITSGVTTALAFNSERFDQAGNAADTQHDNTTNNSRLTCRYAGIYLISVTAAWASAPTGTNTQLGIRHSVGPTLIARQIINVASGVTQQTVTTLYAMAVNEYVEAIVLQASGGAINIASSGNESPEFMMVRVA